MLKLNCSQLVNTAHLTRHSAQKMGGGVRQPAVRSEGRGYVSLMPRLLAEKRCVLMNKATLHEIILFPEST